MAAGRARRARGQGGLDAWPGYVDALSTLLMVIIFVLLVFALAQGFLSFSLTTRDQALARLNQQVAELAEMLALERGQGAEATQRRDRATEELRLALGVRDQLQGELGALREELTRTRAERDAARGAEASTAARIADLDLAERGAGARVAALETRAQDLAARAEAAGLDAAQQAARATDAGRQAQAERTVRQQAEARAAAAEERLQAATAEGRAAAERLAFFERQLAELRAQMARLAAALEVAEGTVKTRDAEIVALGSRLNIALAQKVEELQRYRSDFFGRLRDLLGARADIRVVGDRFVLPAEVLFPPGSAELSAPGLRQLQQVARVVQEIGAQIPADVPWVLRIDGHADRTPIRNSRYASNWALSGARALAVAQRLIADGVPANRLAATALGDNQPIDAGETPEALARNRRIELRLTDR
jgi:chemotaxis protein MotB